MSDKIKLSFVNNGKPFVIPKLSVERNEEILEELAKDEKNLDEKTLAKKLNKMIVLKVLQSVDESISLSDINNMHPADFNVLFRKIWLSGRELSDEEDFR